MELVIKHFIDNDDLEIIKTKYTLDGEEITKEDFLAAISEVAEVEDDDFEDEDFDEGCDCDICPSRGECVDAYELEDEEDDEDEDAIDSLLDTFVDDIRETYGSKYKIKEVLSQVFNLGYHIGERDHKIGLIEMLNEELLDD